MDPLTEAQAAWHSAGVEQLLE